MLKKQAILINCEIVQREKYNTKGLKLVFKREDGELEKRTLHIPANPLNPNTIFNKFLTNMNLKVTNSLLGSNNLLKLDLLSQSKGKVYELHLIETGKAKHPRNIVDINIIDTTLSNIPKNDQMVTVW